MWLYSTSCHGDGILKSHYDESAQGFGFNSFKQNRSVFRRYKIYWVNWRSWFGISMKIIRTSAIMKTAIEERVEKSASRLEPKSSEDIVRGLKRDTQIEVLGTNKAAR